MKNKDENKTVFIPIFKKHFLMPKYWGAWIILFIGCCFALLPGKWRDPLLAFVGRTLSHLPHSARRRSRINLLYCMPELSAQNRETIIDNMFRVALQSAMLIPRLALFRRESVIQNVVWHNRNIIDQLKAEQQNVIFSVPHGFSIDIPAMLLANEGQKMAILIRRQRNEVVDYVWNKLRQRFGGRIHLRDDGIGPFIRSVKQGYWGYYLSDQDHGAKQSQFVDFFGTYKATLPVLGRLKKICNAKIVPLFPVYDSQTHQLNIFVRPPMEGLDNDDETVQAIRMNSEIEALVRPYPEHYNWALKLLKTRKEGEEEPYLRKDL